MTTHDHTTHVAGCFRCDLSREEGDDQFDLDDVVGIFSGPDSVEWLREQRAQREKR